MGKSLLRIKDLSNQEIEQLIAAAQKFQDHKITKTFKNKIVANLFFEPSTRTHYSFVTAEYRLGCKPIDFQISTSSVNKGETFYDTVKTFASFEVDALVIRSAQNE
ncbi:hypothetical protein FACS1894218_2160 [Bacilli bacterium]|nr:hypothetical protein FACS1894218_2160 [Bacilli bacterium]